jgi:hypothetical protein
MDDYYEYIRQGKRHVRLSIWESSKIPLGYVKWQVQRYELGWWTSCGVGGVATFDVALTNGRYWLHDAFNATADNESKA